MDYAQIKLDDPGGALDAALSALQAMTVDVVKTLDANQLTIWAGKHNVIPSFEGDVGPTQGVSKAALTLLNRANGSLDVEDADVQTMLGSLVATGVLTQAAVDDLTAMATEKQPKYPGIHMGDLQNARAI